LRDAEDQQQPEAGVLEEALLFSGGDFDLETDAGRQAVLDRAKVLIRKGFYSEARRGLGAALDQRPGWQEAQELFDVAGTMQHSGAARLFRRAPLILVLGCVLVVCAAGAGFFGGLFVGHPDVDAARRARQDALARLEELDGRAAGLLKQLTSMREAVGADLKKLDTRATGLGEGLEGLRVEAADTRKQCGAILQKSEALAHRLDEMESLVKAGADRLARDMERLLTQQGEGLTELGRGLADRLDKMEGVVKASLGRLAGEMSKVRTVHGNRLRKLGEEIRDLRDTVGNCGGDALEQTAPEGGVKQR